MPISGYRASVSTGVCTGANLSTILEMVRAHVDWTLTVTGSIYLPGPSGVEIGDRNFFGPLSPGNV